MNAVEWHGSTCTCLLCERWGGILLESRLLLLLQVTYQVLPWTRSRCSRPWSPTELPCIRWCAGSSPVARNTHEEYTCQLLTLSRTWRTANSLVSTLAAMGNYTNTLVNRHTHARTHTRRQRKIKVTSAINKSMYGPFLLVWAWSRDVYGDFFLNQLKAPRKLHGSWRKVRWIYYTVTVSIILFIFF